MEDYFGTLFGTPDVKRVESWDGKEEPLNCECDNCKLQRGEAVPFEWASFRKFEPRPSSGIHGRPGEYYSVQHPDTIDIAHEVVD